MGLLTAAGLDRVVAVGTSAGGILAMALAVARPAVLAGVVLNDIVPEIGEEGEARILRDSARDLRPLDWAEGARLLRDTWGAAWISPMGNRRLRIAIFSASSHRTLFSRSDIDQPTISIVARSLTAAR